MANVDGTSMHDADVVVVGAGLGGLVAAAYLAVSGKRVIVVDRHSVAGGNASVFTHHDYEFDVGVHYLGDVGPDGPFAQVLGPLGIDVTWRPLDPDGFETYHFGGGRFSGEQVFRVPAGADAFRTRLHEAFPAEKVAVDAYVDVLTGLRESLAGRGRAELMLEHADTTLGAWFDRHGLSTRLRAVLAAQNGTYALPPSRVSLLLHAGLAGHYLDGGFYPEGGGQVFAAALVEVIRAHRGEVILRTPVEQIVVERGAVRGVRLRPPLPERRRGVPEVINAPVVVSNADLKRTVLELVGEEHWPAETVARTRGYEMTLPLFVVYLVLDRDLRAEGHPNTNVWMFPDDDFDRAYGELLSGRVPTDPFAYLTFASLKDPGNERLCRPGQTNLQAMTLVPGDHAFWGVHGGPAAGERYRRNDVYRARKAEIADRVVAAGERALPGLRDAIVYQEEATPITHERFVRSSGGTSYGIAATPEQFLFHRPAAPTEIPGLFLCGASTIRGHGIAGVMVGGLWAAAAALGESVDALVAAAKVG